MVCFCLDCLSKCSATWVSYSMNDLNLCYTWCTCTCSVYAILCLVEDALCPSVPQYAPVMFVIDNYQNPSSLDSEVYLL